MHFTHLRIKIGVDSGSIWPYPLYVTNVSHLSDPILEMQIFLKTWNNKMIGKDNEISTF